MEEQTSVERSIIRTEWGLTIAGTRITLYDMMDYLTADYPAKLIREKLCLIRQNAERLFKAIASGRMIGYVTATTLTDIFYIARRLTQSIDRAR